MERPFRIGVPSKGRLAELSADLLRQAGFSFRRRERSLFARVKDRAMEIAFLRAEDIPVLCAEGAVDLGITGSDLVQEAGVSLQTRLELGVGRCRLVLCVPCDSETNNLSGLNGARIASSFPRTTEAYLKGRGVSAHLVTLSGSVEVMVALGVADAVVDLVETGGTLDANRLRILEEIGAHETVLIQAPEPVDVALADRVVRRIEGVVIAREYSLLEYNIPRKYLAEAEKITPGYNSPTVNTLEDPDWCAVQVVVKRDTITDVMDQLEALGASAILETAISNCRL